MMSDPETYIDKSVENYRIYLRHTQRTVTGVPQPRTPIGYFA